MTVPMCGSPWQAQQNYWNTAGSAWAGQPGVPYQNPYMGAGAAGGQQDPYAILGAIIQPLMGLMFSLLTGDASSQQTDSGSASGSSKGRSSGSANADNTLGSDSETSDYLDVLSDKSNAKDLKALEKKFGKGVNDGNLTADEIHNIVRAIEKGKKGTEGISADLQAALTWLDKDETGQTVLLNLTTDFDKKGNAAVDIRTGFDENNIEDVDALEEEPEQTNALDALTYLKEHKDFAVKIDANGDNKLNEEEIKNALEKNKNLSAEEKAVLRLIGGSNFKKIQDVWNQSDPEGFSIDGSEKGKLTTALDNEDYQSELEDIY